MTHFTESTIEETALEWLKEIGYAIVFGGDIAPEEPAAAYLRQEQRLPVRGRTQTGGRQVALIIQNGRAVKVMCK